MPWILIDVVLVVLALAALGLLGLRLFRQVKKLSRTVSTAGEVVGRATDELAAAQASTAPRARPVVTGRSHPGQR